MSEHTGQGATGGPGQVAQAAAAAVAPDALTAELLAKHAAGQKLDPAGYGKIGAWKARLKTVFTGKGEPGGKPNPAGPGNAPGVGTVAPAQTSGGVLPNVEADAMLARRTTSFVLKRVDAITARWIAREAVKAGASGKILSDFQSSASLAPPDKELLSELSPDILAELGVSPRQFPVLTAAAVVGLHTFNLWQCVAELKEMQRGQRVERLKQEGQRQAAAVVVTPQAPVIFPQPAKPPGVTEVFCNANEQANPPKN